MDVPPIKTPEQKDAGTLHAPASPFTSTTAARSSAPNPRYSAFSVPPRSACAVVPTGAPPSQTINRRRSIADDQMIATAAGDRKEPGHQYRKAARHQPY